MTGQVPGDGALACAGGPVNGYYEVSLWLLLLGGFFRTHPRFFVPCLLRLLKKRLAVVAVRPTVVRPDAVRPAAVSAGRLLRAAGRASLRGEVDLATGFMLLPFPFLLAHAGPVGLPLR